MISLFPLPSYCNSVCLCSPEVSLFLQSVGKKYFKIMGFFIGIDWVCPNIRFSVNSFLLKFTNYVKLSYTHFL